MSFHSGPWILNEVLGTWDLIPTLPSFWASVFSFETAFESHRNCLQGVRGQAPKQAVFISCGCLINDHKPAGSKVEIYSLSVLESGNPIINQNIRRVTLPLFFFKLFFLLLLSIYFRWHCISVAVLGLSLVPASGGSSLLRCLGFSSGSTGSRFMTQQLWHSGFVAPRHVEFSWTRDWSQVPCIGRQILHH